MSSSDSRRTKLPGGEFRALWLAEALSVVGDQLAKVAVALLVYGETGSAAWSGVSYGLTFLPPLLTGPTLSRLADCYPRRNLMVICCLCQSACVAVMAVPQLSLAAVVVGALLVAAIQTPFKAAQGGLVLDVLGPSLNKSGRARLVMVREIGQFAGLAGAAAAVTAVGTSSALAIDAATFTVAALLIALVVQPRPAERSNDGAGKDQGIRTVLRAMISDPAMRLLTTLIAVIGFTAVPDAVVVPFVSEAGAATWLIGPLLAADCAGVIVGSWWVERQAEARQRSAMIPLALISFVPLTAFLASPAPWVAIVLLIVSGVGSAYLSLAIGEMTERVPRSITGATNGVVNMVLRVGQGVGAIAAGVLAQWTSAATAIAVAGVCGIALVAMTAARSRGHLSDSATEGVTPA